MKKLAGFLFLFSSFYAIGQPLDSVIRKLSEVSGYAASLYFASQAETLPIHNGRIFYGYPGMMGHPFYPVPAMQNSSLLYDGTWYHNVSLIYDVCKDEIITLHPNTSLIRLFSERVQQFYFQGYTFLYLSPDKDHVNKSGFYQLLAEGNVNIYARRRKIIEEKIVDVKLERKFVFSTQYYILKDSIYYEINKQKSLLNLLKDSKQSIIQHLKLQKLKFKTDKEKTIIEIAEFYNQSHK
jgi:hypothetical protein